MLLSSSITSSSVKPITISTNIVATNTIKCLSKRRIYSFLKIFFIIIVFCLYFIILLKASMASMEDGKYKITKLDQANNLHRPTYNNRDHKSFNSNNNNNIYNSNNKSRKSSYHTNNKNISNKTILTTTTTVNPIYEYSEEMNTAAENEFNERKQILWDTCIKRKIVGKYPPNAWEFFISPGHGITWCNVFKAASSTWMYYFNILGGYNIKFLQRTNKSPLELARNRFPRPNLSELSEALSNSISFLTVREPFERLLSAYRNKLEGNRQKYYKLLGKQIVQKFRKKSNDKRNLPGPTFREFLLYLVNHHKNGGHFDEHWSPIYTFCTPCSINFTLVAKVETFQRDTEYIIRQAGLETLLLNKLPQNNNKIKTISNRSTSDTKSLISHYFSQIDENLLRDVLKVYELDFALFGYNSTKYFEYVQSSSSLSLPTTVAPTTTTNSTGL